MSGAAAADQAYRDGIRANMTKLGVAAAAINAYIAARPALASVANPLQEIITEKYIANFLKTEPWNDWRRTGFPVVPLVPQAVINTIPQRIRAPELRAEQQRHSGRGHRNSDRTRGNESEAVVGRRRQQMMHRQETSLMHRITALLLLSAAGARCVRRRQSRRGERFGGRRFPSSRTGPRRRHRSRRRPSLVR